MSVWVTLGGRAPQRAGDIINRFLPLNTVSRRVGRRQAICARPTEVPGWTPGHRTLKHPDSKTARAGDKPTFFIQPHPAVQDQRPGGSRAPADRLPLERALPAPSVACEFRPALWHFPLATESMGVTWREPFAGADAPGPPCPVRLREVAPRVQLSPSHRRYRCHLYSLLVGTRCCSSLPRVAVATCVGQSWQEMFTGAYCTSRVKQGPMYPNRRLLSTARYPTLSACCPLPTAPPTRRTPLSAARCKRGLPKNFSDPEVCEAEMEEYARAARARRAWKLLVSAVDDYGRTPASSHPIKTRSPPDVCRNAGSLPLPPSSFFTSRHLIKNILFVNVRKVALHNPSSLPPSMFLLVDNKSPRTSTPLGVRSALFCPSPGRACLLRVLSSFLLTDFATFTRLVLADAAEAVQDAADQAKEGLCDMEQAGRKVQQPANGLRKTRLTTPRTKPTLGTFIENTSPEHHVRKALDALKTLLDRFAKRVLRRRRPRQGISFCMHRAQFSNTPVSLLGGRARHASFPAQDQELFDTDTDAGRTCAELKGMVRTRWAVLAADTDIERTHGARAARRRCRARWKRAKKRRSKRWASPIRARSMSCRVLAMLKDVPDPRAEYVNTDMELGLENLDISWFGINPAHFFIRNITNDHGLSEVRGARSKTYDIQVSWSEAKVMGHITSKCHGLRSEVKDI
ncbi:hypothetical protein GGX14DRAFT_658732 [Mycena pura]|uniref:Uncharacterized protein n=1 Tax=Mycena pura TaxID=153505 RepID=A0AAD6V649_9AGAR|nr:hypothetical protein GGX14DRAFT_658732 [Mycena pura]